MATVVCCCSAVHVCRCVLWERGCGPCPTTSTVWVMTSSNLLSLPTLFYGWGRTLPTCRGERGVIWVRRSDCVRSSSTDEEDIISNHLSSVSSSSSHHQHQPQDDSTKSRREGRTARDPRPPTRTISYLIIYPQCYHHRAIININHKMILQSHVARVGLRAILVHRWRGYHI